MLDTNVVSALVRDPHGPVAAKIAEVGEEDVCLSIIVAAELRYVAAKKGSLRLMAQLETVLGALEVVPLEAPADMTYGELRTDLERRGLLIGPNDLFIAAQALSLGCTLVTNNEREFGRVTGLRMENWLK